MKLANKLAVPAIVIGVGKYCQQICAGQDLVCTFFRFHLVQYGSSHKYVPLIAMMIINIA